MNPLLALILSTGVLPPAAIRRTKFGDVRNRQSGPIEHIQMPDPLTKRQRRRQKGKRT